MMKSFSSTLTAVATLFILNCQSTSPTAVATQSHTPFRVEPVVRYADVIDEAFRFSEDVPAEFKGVEARIVIRYLPSSSQSESQIVLLKNSDGTMRVIRYQLQPESPPIAVVYERELKKDGSMSLEQILKRVRVAKVERDAKAVFVQFVNQLPAISIPTNLNSDLCMDGVTYEFWLQTPSNKIHASLSSCAYGRETDSVPIVHWLKSIDAELRKGI